MIFNLFDSIEGGELFERVICDDFILTEKACSIFIRQICEGLEYIHSKNILHLDLKVSLLCCTLAISSAKRLNAKMSS